MIIVGAKGFAKQLVEVFFQLGEPDQIFFFDDVTLNCPSNIYGFNVIRKFAEAEEIFKRDPTFCLGIGQPVIRKSLSERFKRGGGELRTVISPKAHIANNVRSIGAGTTILTGAIIENDTILHEGVLVNSLAVVHHDSVIGGYCEIGPGAKILGNCILEENVFVGANATILPKIKIGKNAIIGAGAVVTKDIPTGLTVVGSPAKPLNI